MLFAPSEEEFLAKPGEFLIGLRPSDLVLPMCHEGMNRSQVRLRRRFPPFCYIGNVPLL